MGGGGGILGEGGGGVEDQRVYERFGRINQNTFYAYTVRHKVHHTPLT